MNSFFITISTKKALAVAHWCKDVLCQTLTNSLHSVTLEVYSFSSNMQQAEEEEEGDQARRAVARRASSLVPLFTPHMLQVNKEFLLLYLLLSMFSP